MPDFNKGDFTQQGVNGHVNATVRLNEKRLVNIDLTSNEEATGCTITGTVKDLLNDKVYGIGAGVSGNIEITENGENINVAPYATATVNVSGGGLPTMALTIINDTGEVLLPNVETGLSHRIVDSYGIDILGGINIDETYEATVLYDYAPGIFGNPDEYNVWFAYLYGDSATEPSATNLNNCTFDNLNDTVKLKITDPSRPSSATVTLTKGMQ